MTSERTSIDENEVERLDNISPRKVNIDVLKQKIYLQEKKEKLQVRITLLGLFMSVCIIGFLITI